MSLKREDIEKSIKWTGEWRVVYVKSKEDHMKVRNGVPTSTFWDLWREHKDEIKKLGISVKKEENEDEGTSEWKVSHWAEATDDEKEDAKNKWESQQQRFNGETE